MRIGLAAYVRRNHLALVALFIALGGTSAWAVGEINSRDILDNSVKSIDLRDGGVKTIDVRNGDLTGEDVEDGAIAGADLLDGGVAGADVQNESLTGTDIQNATIAGIDVLDASLTGTDVQTGTIAGVDVTDESLTDDDVQNSSLTGTDVVDGTIAPADLATIPVARVRRTVSQTITSGAFQAIALTTETIDTASIHSNVTNNTRLTAPRDGAYLLTANVFWDFNPAGTESLGLTVNGNFVAATDHGEDAAGSTFHAISTMYVLNQGQFVEAKVLQNSGANASVGASSGGSETSPEVSMTWLGPA